MKKFLVVFLLLSGLLLIDGCTRRPAARREPDFDGRMPSSLRQKREISVKPTPAKQTIAGKVQQLSNEIEKAYRRGRVSAEDLVIWARLYSEYCMEYAVSTHLLTDKECESVEFNLGKIAGRIYKDTIAPAIDELQEIADGLEEYEQRSRKWEGAMEEGFKSVAGSSIWDQD